MGCIPALLKWKEITGGLVSRGDGGVLLEGGGNYRGHDYLITFQSIGFRCGYVAVPKDLSFELIDSKFYRYPDLDVHGGVTFYNDPLFQDLVPSPCIKDMWVGFDAGHAGDSYQWEEFLELTKIPTDSELYKSIQTHIAIHMSVRGGRRVIEDDFHKIRTYEYMEEECKRLIDQIVEIEKQNQIIRKIKLFFKYKIKFLKERLPI